MFRLSRRLLSKNNHKYSSYAEYYLSYRPNIPQYYNIGYDVCDKHVINGYGNSLALIYVDGPEEQRYTFNDLKLMSDRLANGLQTLCNIKAQDRIGIFMPQAPETGIAHIATYKTGAIALPLFKLFGPEAIEYRLNNSRAKCIITDEEGWEMIQPIRRNLPYIESIIVVTDKPTPKADGVYNFHHYVLSEASDNFSMKPTLAEDPALIIYTSGTTGTPKGCLHAHRVLLGHLPGVEMPHNFFPQPNDLFWTPADWAWIGGLLDVLMPSWHHGVPVLAHRAAKFDADDCFHMLRKYKVRNTFMPATVLRLLQKGTQQTYPELRSLGSGGETLGAGLLKWGQDTFDVTINEFYGQTECNLILSNCSDLMEVKPGSMGKPVPGKIVDIVDPDGHPVLPGEVGDVAVRKPDLTMFLRYWDMPEATEDKFRNGWLLTGDQARMDKDDYFWFVGRDDDIICSAGYRIGPGEVEECLLGHKAVALAAVVGSPDDERGEIVKAFIVLKDANSGDIHTLKEELMNWVGSRLAWHEKPREIEFVSELPIGDTGKVKRAELRELERKRKQRHSI